MSVSAVSTRPWRRIRTRPHQHPSIHRLIVLDINRPSIHFLAVVVLAVLDCMPGNSVRRLPTRPVLVFSRSKASVFQNHSTVPIQLAQLKLQQGLQSGSITKETLIWYGRQHAQILDPGRPGDGTDRISDQPIYNSDLEPIQRRRQLGCLWRKKVQETRALTGSPLLYCYLS